jgi:hypothetical protein
MWNAILAALYLIVETGGGNSRCMCECKSGETAWLSGFPSPLAEDAEVREETVLNLAVSEGKIEATPVEKKKYSLKLILDSTVTLFAQLVQPVGRVRK